MASYTVTAKQREDNKKKSSNSSGSLTSGSTNTTSKASTANQTSQYNNTNTTNTGNTYDSAGVIGNMDNNYGIKKGTGNGYGEGNGYNNRETAYTFQLADGTKKTIYSNATTYTDAAKLAGIDLSNGAKLANAMTYGTASSSYSKPGYGFGTIGGSNDFTTNLYANNQQTGNFHDQNLMQLAYLSGRDGRDYLGSFANPNYTGNGIQNAYNRGTEVAGQGELMGGYNANYEYPDMSLDNFIANGGDYSTLDSVYGSAYANANNTPIRGTTNTSGDSELPLQALAQIQAYQQQYQAAAEEYQKTGSAEAKNAMAQAHQAAEAVRSQYGYSGGTNGTGSYTPLGTYNDAGLPSDALAQIKQLQADYQSAIARGDTASANAAHQAAEAIRSQYSYSGGIDGSDYIGNGQNNTLSSAYAPLSSGFQWNYEEPGDYDSEYKGYIDDLLAEILDRDEFSYDVNSDPLYQQYKSQYLREGQRAMNDTLASAASGAGGMNSYAISAAQQAQNYYDAQLGDKIPELYQLAYNMYLNDVDRDVQNLGLLEDLDNTQYNRYRDDISDYYTDKNFAYNQYRDDVSDSQWQQQFNYNANRDTVSDNQWQQQFDYSVQSDAYQQAMNFLSAGIMPSTELLSRAGLSQSDAQNYLNALLLGSSGSTSSSSGSGTSKKKAKVDDEDDENDKKFKIGDEEDEYKKLKAEYLNSLSNNDDAYAYGLYTDLVKSGYSLSDIDEILTEEYNKGHITKNEADYLANLLIG